MIGGETFSELIFKAILWGSAVGGFVYIAFGMITGPKIYPKRRRPDDRETQ